MYSTLFETHFYSDHMWFPLEKSRHFIQQGLLPGPFSFLAIFPTGCLNSLSFSLKKVKVFFSLQAKKQLKCSDLPRKTYTLSKYQIWENLQSIVYLELHSLEKCQENSSIKTEKKSEKTICSFLWQTEWKSCDKQHKPTHVCVSHIRAGTECFLQTSFHIIWIFSE